MATLAMPFIAFAAGFLIAFPVGPLTLIAADRALRRGFRSGLSIGVGCSIADNMIALAVFYGFARLAGSFAPQAGSQLPRLFGGVVCAVMGAYLIATSSRPVASSTKAASGSGIIFGFFMTMTNPANAMSIAGVIGLFGIRPGSLPAVAVTSASMLAGAVFAWSAVIYILWRPLKNAGPGLLRKIRITMGALLMFLGLIYMLVAVLR